MCLKKLEDLKNIKGKNLKNLKDYDLIVTHTDSKNNIEKNKYLLQIIPRLVIEDNIKVSILNSKIPIGTMFKFLAQKQIEVNNIKDLSKEERKNKLKNIKSLSNSNLHLNYTSETTIDEIINKCKKLKEEKAVELIIIEDIKNISDYQIDNQNEIFKRFEQLSQTLKATIMIML